MAKVFFDITAGDKPLGKIVFKLYDDVPKTAETFRKLATSKTKPPNGYIGSKFHQAQPTFFLGDLITTTFTVDQHSKKHDKPGLLSFAKDGNGYRFIITTAKDPALDKRKYVVFGEVAEGYEEVVKKIAKEYVDNTGSFKTVIKIVNSGTV